MNKPEWHKQTHEVIRTISEAYLLSPANPRSLSSCHECTLLGHKVVLYLEGDGFTLLVGYLGWYQVHRGMFGSKWGTEKKLDIKRGFDIRDPAFIDKLDDFFQEIGLPVLYAVERERHSHWTETHDLERTRQICSVTGESYRPATYDEIRSINAGANAVWMMCQNKMLGCKSVDDWVGGLWYRIQHQVMDMIWADKNFDQVRHFMEAFLDKETRATLSRDHKDEDRTHRSTYSSCENDWYHQHGDPKNPTAAALARKASKSKHRRGLRRQSADAQP